MKTGEGKTLTGTLAVVLNSLAGRGVHVVTVNDYLARRDAMWMKPIYDMLGVIVGDAAEHAALRGEARRLRRRRHLRHQLQVTCGAKSGLARTTPLLYTPHDGGFIVVASKAGAAQHPAWYHNIRAHPDAVTVELGGERIAVQPRVVDEPERRELWQRVNDNYNGYDAYEQRAGGRVIPVVWLQPVSPE